MKSEIKRKWLNALQKSTFPQANEGVFLKDAKTYSFGTIGVLVELYRIEHNIADTPGFWENCWTGQTLKNIESWAGFEFEKPAYMRVFASIMQVDTHLHQLHAVWLKKHLPVTSIEKRLKYPKMKVVL